MSRLFAVVCRATPAALGVAAASCAQVAGIENTVGAGNSIAVTRVSISTAVARAEVGLDQFSATYFVASHDASGYDRISAVPDPKHSRLTSQVRMPAPVQVALGGETAPIPQLYAFPASHLSVLDLSESPATSAVSGNTLFGTLGQPGRPPAAAGATFAVNVTLDAAVALAGQTFQTYVVGAWLQRAFLPAEAMPAATQIGPVTFGFTAANGVSGRSQVDQITTDDAFLVLRYTNSVLSGVAEAMPFTQADAVTTPTFPTMVPVVPAPIPQAFSGQVAQAVISDRYKAVRPSVMVPPAFTWSVVAAPGSAYGSNAGPVLASGTLGPMDTGPTTNYENPFAARGWNAIFTLATSASRMSMAPLGPTGTPAAVTLYAGMNQSLEPPPPPPPGSPLPHLELPAGLPQVITIDSTVLVVDGSSIKRSSQFYNVSFTVDAPVTTDPAVGARFYNLQLFHLKLDATAMTVSRELVFAAAGKDPTFALPPELLQVNESYVLRAVSTIGGFPGAEQGDFSTQQLPLAQSYLDSGVFTVMP